VSVGYKDK
jgi:hypothetical protein